MCTLAFSVFVFLGICVCEFGCLYLSQFLYVCVFFESLTMILCFVCIAIFLVCFCVSMFLCDPASLSASASVF